jgi:hypothetical protein
MNSILIEKQQVHFSFDFNTLCILQEKNGWYLNDVLAKINSFKDAEKGIDLMFLREFVFAMHLSACEQLEKPVVFNKAKLISFATQKDNFDKLLNIAFKGIDSVNNNDVEIGDSQEKKT